VKVVSTASHKDVAFGCSALGGHGWTGADPTEIAAAVELAVGERIALFDTADVYGFGASEVRLANALGNARHRVTIITKVGLRWDERSRVVVRDGTPAYLRRAVEASLRRLRLEVIPVVLLHWPDPLVPVAESLGALSEMAHAGLIRGYGASNLVWSPNTPPIVVDWAQRHCSLLTRPDERAATGQLRTMAWGCLEQGLLTSNATQIRHMAADDWRRRLPLWSSSSQRAVRAVRAELEHSADAIGDGMTAAQCAIRWVLDAGLADIAVVGIRTCDQLREALAVRERTLSESLVQRLFEVSAPHLRDSSTAMTDHACTPT
jgi:myo-inositol catabolism protein IolS